MNAAETLLARKMAEAEPFLDLSGSDSKLFQVAYQDFKNYLKFTWNPTGSDVVEFDVAGKIEQYLKEDVVEFEAFMQVWVGMWLKKWKSRVKLLLRNDCKCEFDKIAKTIADAEPLWAKFEPKQEMIDMVVSTLIRHGEICGTEIFAQHLLKFELGKKVDLDLENTEQFFAVVNGALQKARETALIVGPLMFVKIDKAYFAAVK